MCYSFLNLSLKGVILSIRVVLYLVGVVLFPLIGSLPFLYYYSQVLIIANESEPSVIFIVSTLFRIKLIIIFRCYIYYYPIGISNYCEIN